MQGSSGGVQISIIPHFYLPDEPRTQMFFPKLLFLSFSLKIGDSFTTEMTYEPGLKEPESLPADPCGGGEREKGCSR